MTAYDPVLVEAMTNYIRDIRTGAPPWSRKKETPTESDRVLGITALGVLEQLDVDLTETRRHRGGGAAAMGPLLELAASHERYADACKADAQDRWAGSHWAQEAHKARDEAQRIRWAVARGLAAEAGITVDTTTEEA